MNAGLKPKTDLVGKNKHQPVTKSFLPSYLATLAQPVSMLLDTVEEECPLRRRVRVKSPSSMDLFFFFQYSGYCCAKDGFSVTAFEAKNEWVFFCEVDFEDPRAFGKCV